MESSYLMSSSGGMYKIHQARDQDCNHVFSRWRGAFFHDNQDQQHHQHRIMQMACCIWVTWAIPSCVCWKHPRLWGNPIMPKSFDHHKGIRSPVNVETRCRWMQLRHIWPIQQFGARIPTCTRWCTSCMDDAGFLRRCLQCNQRRCAHTDAYKIQQWSSWIAKRYLSAHTPFTRELLQVYLCQHASTPCLYSHAWNYCTCWWILWMISKTWRITIARGNDDVSLKDPCSAHWCHQEFQRSQKSNISRTLHEEIQGLAICHINVLFFGLQTAQLATWKHEDPIQA